MYSAGKPFSVYVTWEITRYGPSPGSTQLSSPSSGKCGQIRAPVASVIQAREVPYTLEP